MAKDAVRGVAKPKAVPVVPIKLSTGAAVQRVRKATERLEEDAKDMEDRLAQLRLSMLEEKRKRDAERPAKHGGNRWRSAREDRGSVSKYALDVQNRASAAPRKSAKKRAATAAATTNSTAVLSVATVSAWTTAQVLAWLRAIGLEEYASAFEYHQVTGASLLALTLGEFAQMGVAKLSARNTLYTALAAIRDAAAAAGDSTDKSGQDLQQRRPPAPPTEIVDPKLRDVQPAVQSGGNSSGGVHWSQLKPLADTAVAVGSADVPVNLADGAFDEDASHASFLNALLEWRSCDSDQAAADANGGTSDGTSDELWVNPMVSLYDSDDATGTGAVQSRLPPGGALLEGSYDEAKEQEAFRRAVAAWRSGSSVVAADPNTTQPPPTSIEQIEQGCVAAERKSCWQCYRVATIDSLLVDEQTGKPFCSSACQASYSREYARFYDKQ